MQELGALLWITEN